VNNNQPVLYGREGGGGTGTTSTSFKKFRKKNKPFIGGILGGDSIFTAPPAASAQVANARTITDSRLMLVRMVVKTVVGIFQRNDFVCLLGRFIHDSREKKGEEIEM
jgi:hypothetical protein